MIANLQPYPDYKESGLPAVGRMPAHWSQRRMKFLFRERVQKGFPGEPLLAATQTKGVVRKADYGERTVTVTKDFHLLKLVEPGDYVISLRSFEGGIEVAHCRGIISPAYTVLTPQPDAQGGYFTRFFKAPDFIRSLTLFVTGIREGQNIDYERLSRAYMPLPPPDEQAAIVRFLDYANGRLERAIRSKRKVIALLHEQKQAIIHRAVTRGLDPTVPLKPSGIPWLGDIPQHWETPRLAQLSTRIGDGLHGTPEYVDQSSFHFINGNNLVNGSIRLKASSRCVGLAEFKKHKVPLDESSLLISINGTIGSVALYRGESVILGKSAAYINCNKSLIREYLLCFLQSPAVVNFLRQEVTGTTIFNLSLASIRGLPIALPSIDEQLKIVEGIEKNTSPVSAAIARLEREITLLREYRTRLVADVVTGKLDVREAAAKLPDLPAESAPEAVAEDTQEDIEGGED